MTSNDDPENAYIINYSCGDGAFSAGLMFNSRGASIFYAAANSIDCMCPETVRNLPIDWIDFAFEMFL